MLDERIVPGSRFGPEVSTAFVERLQEIVDASLEPDAVESTLRCIEVYEHEVVETLFSPVRGRVECVSQVRPARPADLQAPSLEREDAATVRMGLRWASLLGILLVITFGLVAWQEGWIGRVFGPDAGDLAREPGAFGAMIEIEVEQRWGNYRVTLTRGLDYPIISGDVETLLDAAATPVQRAAVNAVANGTEVYVRLVGAKGKVLEARRVQLGALLAADDGSVETTLPGHVSARGVELALESGGE